MTGTLQAEISTFAEYKSTYNDGPNVPAIRHWNLRFQKTF